MLNLVTSAGGHGGGSGSASAIPKPATRSKSMAIVCSTISSFSLRTNKEPHQSPINLIPSGMSRSRGVFIQLKEKGGERGTKRVHASSFNYNMRRSFVLCISLTWGLSRVFLTLPLHHYIPL